MLSCSYLLSARGFQSTPSMPYSTRSWFSLMDNQSCNSRARSVLPPFALITTTDLRRHVRALLAEHVPDLPVVTARELMPHLSLSAGALIGP